LGQSASNLERIARKTYDGYAVIVNVCLVVELLFDFCVLDMGPEFKCQLMSRVYLQGDDEVTYLRPSGCKLVLLTAGGAMVADRDDMEEECK
jgi:hypothetical protein